MIEHLRNEKRAVLYDDWKDHRDDNTELFVERSAEVYLFNGSFRDSFHGANNDTDRDHNTKCNRRIPVRFGSLTARESRWMKARSVCQ